MTELKTAQLNVYNVTGTYHGSIVVAESEGEARRMFHKAYNGESITHLTKMGKPRQMLDGQPAKSGGAVRVCVKSGQPGQVLPL